MKKNHIITLRTRAFTCLKVNFVSVTKTLVIIFFMVKYIKCRLVCCGILSDECVLCA